MSIKVGVGLSIKNDPVEAAEEALQKARINVPEEDADLAVVFTSIELSHNNLLTTLKSRLPYVPILGCSSAAIISNQGIFKHGLVIALLNFPEDVYFNTASINDIDSLKPSAAGEELGKKLLYGFKDVRRDLGLIFYDGLMQGSEGLVEGMQKKLGISFPLIGASASDNLKALRTYTYFNEEISTNSASGVLWGGKLNFSFGIQHGWEPLGKPHLVTKAEGNTIYEIDSAPAAILYEEYLDYDLITLNKELSRISTLYPIGLYLAGEEEYLLRNIVSIGDDGSLVLRGNVPQGSRIRLMIGTKESCLRAARHAINEAKNALMGRHIDIIFVFDSVSRYMLLRREANEEIGIIKEEVGKDTPIIGIYTYGAQAPLRAVDYRGKMYSHNQTITILAIAS